MINDNLEKEIEKLENCVIIYKNGKPKAVKTLELPIVYECQEMSIGQVLKLLETKIEMQNNTIEIQSKQIKALHDINTKIIELIKKNNLVTNVNNINIMESIRELGGNI